MKSRIFRDSISVLGIVFSLAIWNGQFAQAEPGKISNRASDLGEVQTTNSTPPQVKADNSTTVQTAQTDTDTDIEPGRATQGGSSYIGIGGNIGIGGGSAIGEGSFTVFSKIGLTENISLRPLGAISDDPTILIPVTYDFNLREVDPVEEIDSFTVSPYVGAGVGIVTSDNADVGFLLTGGVDIPINEDFTGTAGVNALFGNDTSVGLNLGIGYNF